MGCLLILAVFGLPRIGLIVLWFTQPGYVSQALGSALLPILGFLFLPTTTLAFAYGMNGLGGAGGEMPPLGWLLTILGLVVDLGLTGGGAVSRRPKRQK